LVPVYIGYEKIFEENSYLNELRGQQKQKESLWGVLRTLRRLRNYGKVSVNFGTPIDLGQHLDQQQANWRELLQTDGLDRPGWATPAIQQLGQEVVQRINTCAALNPINLIALALLAHPRQALDGETLHRQLALFQHIQQQVPASPELTLPADGPQQWIEHAVRMKILQRETQPLGEIYRLQEAQAILMTYYRNNILHLWVLPSLICNVISVTQLPKTRAAIIAMTARIDTYVQPELLIAGSSQQRHNLIEQYFDCLLALGLIDEDNNEFVPTSDRYQRMHFNTIQRMMQPTLERYYLTLSTLVGHGAHQLSPQALETQAKAMAQRMAALHGLNSPEFFDSSLLRRFIQSLREHELIQLDDDNHLYFDQPIRDILSHTESIMDEELVRQVHILIQRWAEASRVNSADDPAKTATNMIK
jgi:glycerol-3-phosphate O-acyltransferase